MCSAAKASAATIAAAARQAEGKGAADNLEPSGRQQSQLRPAPVMPAVCCAAALAAAPLLAGNPQFCHGAAAACRGRRHDHAHQGIRPTTQAQRRQEQAQRLAQHPAGIIWRPYLQERLACSACSHVALHNTKNHGTERVQHGVMAQLTQGQDGTKLAGGRAYKS